MVLNTFSHALRDLCRRHLFEEKWLLAPSMRVGFQWLDAVTRSGQPVLNARVRTLRQLAIELATPELERRGLTFVGGGGLELDHLVGRLIGRIQRRTRGYLAGLRPSIVLIQSLRRSIHDLRLAGLTAAGLRGRGLGWVEVEAKGRQIEALLAHYERELRAGRRADYAVVLGLATARLNDDLFALPADVLVVAPAHLELTALERRLWLAISGSRRRELPVDLPVEGRAAEATAFFRATGEVNEVREVLRRCFEQGIPLDEVELLHTDAATYVPLIHELACQLVAEDEPPPLTFAEGLPAGRTRPGRALRAWLHWIGEDFLQSALWQMLQDGLLRPPEGTTTELAAVLRQLPVGAGRERYLQVIDRERARVERRAPGDERARRLDALRQLVSGLLAHAPGGPGQRPALEAAAHFLTEHVRCVDELDEYCRQGLVGQIEEQLGCLAASGEIPGLDPFLWLAALPDQLRVGGQGPRPGCLFVADLLGGGHSGRRHTFVLGLDDGRFPGAGRQDPLLLDRERRALAETLPTAIARLAAEVEAFGRLLARLRGQVTLSYSCASLSDDREQFPSSLLLSSYRAATGDREADLDALLSHLGPPVSFAPERAERCTGAGEWWLWRLCDAKVDDAEGVLDAAFPHLGRGLEARRQRLSDRFTEYDGHVPAAGEELDPLAPGGAVLSASALEVVGRCPMEYFLRYVLGVEPEHEAAVDFSAWLDPPTRGALLHEVFCAFMTRLRGEGLLPAYPRDLKLLLDLVGSRVEAQRAAWPPPNQEVYQREVAELEQAARIFLREEQALAQHSLPLYFEVAVGLPKVGEGTLLDQREPARIRLPGGGAIRALGVIDRVDRLLDGEQRYAVWDYKTGSSRRYQERDPFRQGRVVQNALYLALAQARLRERVAAGAAVARFGYFFPSPAELGRRVSWSSADLQQGLRLIEELCRLIAAGSFPLSDRTEDVRFSDYGAALGHTEELARAVRAKLKSPHNPMLAPLARLRGHEQRAE